MADAGRSPRSIAYVLSVIRQVFNFSRRHDFYSGEWPGVDKAVKIPRKDNRRQRFFTHEEADALLVALKAVSTDVHDMSLLSLHCGLRASEVFSLTWADVNLDKGTLFIRDTKSGRNRHAYMTDIVKSMLSDKYISTCDGLVFAARTGNQVDRISKTFSRVVDTLGLNSGITDPR